ncbi:MAG: tRNA-specific adenosine deaminase [Deltaproteobacteria bacterium RIFCSPHIGHO2_02_FULL_50_15]|nr:MAG: tRNA-specific adenosine deaminase [Deltaproteobacteria bacterium RIFCSPHIGHO2_02_FULL_50_15]
MQEDHQKWMTLALEEAQKAREKGEVPIGAVGIMEGNLIARAHNLREAPHNPLGHAEIYVIEQASQHLKRWRLHDMTLYVTVEPCPMCMGALLQARIPTLVFGCRDPKAGASGSLYDLGRDPRLNHQIEVIEGVLTGPCSQIIKDFFQGRRR